MLKTHSPLRHNSPVSSSGPVVIKITGVDASVDLVHAELVANVLESECIAWGNTDGTLRGHVHRQWHGRQVGTTYTFPGKLAPLVGTRLRDRGIVTDLQGLPLTAPPGWDTTGASVRELLWDPRLAGLGGIISPERNNDPRDLIPELLALYPTVRAAVVVRNRDRIRFWRMHLSAACRGRPVVEKHEEHRLWGERDAVLVCTLRALDDLLRGEDFGLIVVVDVAPLLARSVCETTVPQGSGLWIPAYSILCDPSVPAFGFTHRDPRRLSTAERLTLASWFTLFLERPRLGPRVSVSVASVPPSRDVPTDLLDAKRAVWRDDRRNEVIGRLAKDAAAEPHHQVVVLAGSQAHAAGLAQRLMGWLVVVDGGGPLPARTIVTEAWLARGGRIGSGTTSDARGWGALRPADFLADVEATIIDVPAGGHLLFHRRAAERLAAYREFGWSIVSVESVRG